MPSPGWTGLTQQMSEQEGLRKGTVSCHLPASALVALVARVAQTAQKAALTAAQ